MKLWRNVIVFVFSFGLFCVALGLTTGCQTTGGQTTISVPQLILDASSLNNAVVTTTTSLLQAGAISSKDAATVLQITDDLQAAIKTANAIYTAGNTATAQAKLAAVIGIITTATTCVTAAKASGTSLGSCVAPILTQAQGL